MITTHPLSRLKAKLRTNRSLVLMNANMERPE